MTKARQRAESGSALMLVPAGMLVLMALGAIAVDSAIAFSAQRELGNQATAAANDAITLALSEAELQHGDAAEIDAERAEQVVRKRMVGLDYSGLRVAPSDITVRVDQAAGTVSVAVEGDVPYVFAKAVPGARHYAHVKSGATATLRHRTA